MRILVPICVYILKRLHPIRRAWAAGLGAGEGSFLMYRNNTYTYAKT